MERWHYVSLMDTAIYVSRRTVSKAGNPLWDEKALRRTASSSRTDAFILDLHSRFDQQFGQERFSIMFTTDTAPIQPWTLGDEHSNPLPEGTVVEFPSQLYHQAIVAYTVWGEQVLLENTRLHGKATVTNPVAYRGVQHKIARRPSSAEHAARIVNHAVSEIQAGRRWTVFDNCQDFVSRAYDGRNGSKTRTIFLGVASVLGLVGMATASG